MGDIGLKDIIGLAMKGYKPGDIKELIEIAKDASAASESEPKTESAEDNPEPENPEPKKEDPEPKKDELSEAEQLKAEIISLQEKIKEMQSDNINKEVEGKKPLTDEEKFEELVKNYF